MDTPDHAVIRCGRAVDGFNESTFPAQIIRLIDGYLFQVIDSAGPPEPFRLLPLFLVSILIVVASPIYWSEVELRHATVASAPENRDLRAYYYPVYEDAYSRLQAGSFPLWDARRLCGMPMLADVRLGIFHPLHVVFAIMPIREAMAVHAYLCLSLSGIVFVLFLRSFGVGAVSALLGGLTYAFSGAAAAAMSRPPLAAALVCLPLVCWAVREYARSPRIATALFMSMSFALLLLSGAVSLAVSGMLFSVTYCVFLLITPGSVQTRYRFRAVCGLFAAIAVALCVTAVQWLPTLQWLVTLGRPTDLLWGVRPAGTLPAGWRDAIADLVSVNPDPLPSPVYAGIVATIIAPAALLIVRRWQEAFFFAAGMLVLGAAATMPQLTLPFGFPVSAIAYPAVLSVSVLAALGCDRLLGGTALVRARRSWTGTLIVLAAALALFLAGTTQARGYAALVALLVVVLIPSGAMWIRGALGLLVCGLAWTNLVSSSRNVFEHPYQWPERPASSTAEDIVLDDELLLGGRAVAIGASTLWTRADDAGPPQIGGYLAPRTVEQAQWWEGLGGDVATGVLSAPPNPRLFGAMAGRVIVVGDRDTGGATVESQSNEGYRVIRQTPDATIMTNELALPRAYWTGNIRWTAGVAEVLNLVERGEVDISKTALVDAEFHDVEGLAGLVEPSGLAGASPLGPATATVEDVSPEHVVVQVQTPGSGLLILSDTFAPGWHATIDGAPAPIVRVNGLFRGVPTDAGSHTIEFKYQPIAFYVGWCVSMVTLAILAIWGLTRLFR